MFYKSSKIFNFTFEFFFYMMTLALQFIPFPLNG